jgi:hypothetical protein
MNGRALNRGQTRTRIHGYAHTPHACMPRSVDAPGERTRPNHSINPVLYDSLDAILFNKANAAYGPAMATAAPSLTLSPRRGPAENQLAPCTPPSVILSALCSYNCGANVISSPHGDAIFYELSCARNALESATSLNVLSDGSSSSSPRDTRRYSMSVSV